MKIRYLVFVLAIVAAFSAALIFQQEDSAPTITSSPLLIDEPVSMKTPTPPVTKVAEDTGVDWTAVRKRMFQYDVGDKFTDEEIELYNSLHIEPFNQLVQKDCPSDEEMSRDYNEQAFAIMRHQEKNPGSTDLVYKSPCTMIFERPLHAYIAVPIEELRELALSDATAALVMGVRAPRTLDPFNPDNDDRRFAEDQERIEWFYRAAALSGKSGPLITLAELRYSEPSDNDEFIQRIAIEMSAQYLNDPRAQPELWQEKYKEYLSGTPEVKEACPSCTFLQGEELSKVLSENVGIAADWADTYLDKANDVKLLEVSASGEGQ